MKKIALFTLTAAAILATSAQAGTVTVPVTINATVQNSCVFDSGATQTASFSYDANTGSSAAASGGATLYCNKATVATLTTATSGTVALTKGTDTLTAKYTLNSVFSAAAGTGTYQDADKTVYTVAPSADAGQWSASSGSYSGQLTINVDF
ncbi:hypothetical protein D3875_04275 [Deinococcus cavernae]|uniref:Spore coat protein U domain-containing protein n=1 Tax=Deinococcus cavernae TaxID=2320857 RepID=A0A418VEM2_9DEIO|nr:hypothetical protein [Deinococcus cavernae]RJF74503.1 hypothetical protein D3875_04275 [Deinococcus cavernae]